MLSKRFKLALLTATLLIAAPVMATAEADSFAEKIGALPWVKGPAPVEFGSVAKLDMPKGPTFLGKADTGKFLEINGNPPTDDAYTVSAPDLHWFAIFEFVADGRVPDNDKIDSAALLKSMQNNDEADNKARKDKGLSQLFLDGWYIEPHYDRANHNLEWATKLHDDKGNVIVNYTSRILGRSGFMRSILVSDPKNLDKDLAEFRTVMKGYDFTSGQHYSEWRQGDKVAEYGLAALVTGGAAAAAVKTGLFKGIFVALAAAWKLVAAAAVAAAATLRRFIARLFGRGGDPA